MRRMLLLLVVLTVWIGGYGLTIEVGDYGYGEGKVRNYSEGPWNSSGTDLSEGTGKSWSFSMPNAGYVNNTFHLVQNVSGFPTANISADYNQYTTGYYTSGTQYYRNTGSDILSIGYTASPNFVWNPAVPMGLPHYVGKTWTGTHSWQYGSYTVSGKVISEGQITTPLGSYAAVCVRFYYQTNAISYYYYQWETKEYGIIAYVITVNGGMLYVLNQADSNVANDDNVAEFPTLKATTSPNPFANELRLTLKSETDSPARLTIYDLRGRAISERLISLSKDSETELELGEAFLDQAPGIYILTVRAGKEKLTRKITKLP